MQKVYVVFSGQDYGRHHVSLHSKLYIFPQCLTPVAILKEFTRGAKEINPMILTGEWGWRVRRRLEGGGGGGGWGGNRSEEERNALRRASRWGVKRTYAKIYSGQYGKDGGAE